MRDPHDGYEPISDVEALVRSARDYVHASADLRPRVLETARAERAERRTMRRIWPAAVLVVFAGLFTMSARPRPEKVGLLGQPGQSAAAADDSSATGAYGDSAWGMVESFTEMRRRQAELLRLAL